MATAPSSKTAQAATAAQHLEPVLYYVRVGNSDVVVIDRPPTDTLAQVREEIAEEVGTGFRYLRNGVPLSRGSEKRVILQDALTNDKLVVKPGTAEAQGGAGEERLFRDVAHCDGVGRATQVARRGRA